ncbi:unnamed protein product [Paramecium octaurelia]|uniref:Uncharacterized protein n=1 Tax=Paramecium octaurelia TaxID=43137 RepID=A0A8S1YSK4_PAROT|nr:unnamed protein product [Paramecium octaurelia]
MSACDSLKNWCKGGIRIGTICILYSSGMQKIDISSILTLSDFSLNQGICKAFYLWYLQEQQLSILKCQTFFAFPVLLQLLNLPFPLQSLLKSLKHRRRQMKNAKYITVYILIQKDQKNL